jgi:hypothetical protein
VTPILGAKACFTASAVFPSKSAASSKATFSPDAKKQTSIARLYEKNQRWQPKKNAELSNFGYGGWKKSCTSGYMVYPLIIPCKLQCFIVIHESSMGYDRHASF